MYAYEDIYIALLGCAENPYRPNIYYLEGLSKKYNAVILFIDIFTTLRYYE